MSEQSTTADALVALEALRGLRLTDLSYPLHPEMPIFPGQNVLPFERRQSTFLAQHGVNSGRIGMGEHQGTHLDAPIHFIDGAMTMEAIPTEHLVVEAVVIDVTVAAEGDADYRLTVADLDAWVAANGPFPSGAFALMNSGWGSRWVDPTAYVNPGAEGRPHHPACTPEAATWLVEHGAIGLGVDTLSVDNTAPSDIRSPAHKVLHGAGRYVLENLANLDRLPARGILLVIGALPIVDGTAGPARVLAFNAD